MSGTKKYQKGDKPLTVDDAFNEIMERRTIFFDDKVVSSGWSQNWSVATLRGLCGAGHLYPAIVRQEWRVERGRRLRKAVDKAVTDAQRRYPVKELAQ